MVNQIRWVGNKWVKNYWVPNKYNWSYARKSDGVSCIDWTNSTLGNPLEVRKRGLILFLMSGDLPGNLIIIGQSKTNVIIMKVYGFKTSPRIIRRIHA